MENNTLSRRMGGKTQHLPKKEKKFASSKQRTHHPVIEGRETAASLQRRRKRNSITQRELSREQGIHKNEIADETDGSSWNR